MTQVTNVSARTRGHTIWLEGQYYCLSKALHTVLYFGTHFWWYLMTDPAWGLNGKKLLRRVCAAVFLSYQHRLIKKLTALQRSQQAEFKTKTFQEAAAAKISNTQRLEVCRKSNVCQVVIKEIQAQLKKTTFPIQAHINACTVFGVPSAKTHLLGFSEWTSADIHTHFTDFASPTWKLKTKRN